MKQEKVKDIDGNEYKLIEIGNQVWMQENLKVEKFRNGENIDYIKNHSQWIKSGKDNKPAFAYYSNDKKNNIIYGNLYNWHVISDSRGIAPDGFHVPEMDEWYQLIDFLGGGEIAGINLKLQCWNDQYGNEVNDTKNKIDNSFLALPGGIRDYNDFSALGSLGVWWSASENIVGGEYANNIGLYDSNKVRILGPCGGEFGALKECGLSIRCIRD